MAVAAYLHKATLILIHLVLALCTVCWRFWEATGTLVLPRTLPVAQLRQATRHLSKMPQHICFAFQEAGRNSVIDAAWLVAWAGASGIEYISIWDMDGSIMTDLRRFRKDVGQVTREFFGKVAPDFAVHVQGQLCSDPHERVVHVTVLSPTDDRNALVRLTKLVANEPTRDRVNVQEISKRLTLLGGDPDLMLLLGEYDVLGGILPWHLATTEFITVPNHRGIRCGTFLNALQRFAGCIQRWGK